MRNIRIVPERSRDSVVEVSQKDDQVDLTIERPWAMVGISLTPQDVKRVRAALSDHVEHLQRSENREVDREALIHAVVDRMHAEGMPSASEDRGNNLTQARFDEMKETLIAVLGLWATSPEQRLGQLIANMTRGKYGSTQFVLGDYAMTDLARHLTALPEPERWEPKR